MYNNNIIIIIEINAIIVLWQFILISGQLIERLKINKDCIPPLGDSCIEIRQCPFFADLLGRTSIPRPRNVIKAIREHHCGFQGDSPKVCCFPELRKIKRMEVEERINSTELLQHPNTHLLPLDVCGALSNEFRIINGFKTIPLEFPWMTLIAYNTSEGLDFKCGGTLINERYILTAAHCVQNLTIVWIRLGEHNIETENDCNQIQGICAPPIQDFEVEDIIIHSNYVASSYKNDIALIRLAGAANFSYANVLPICLPIGETANLNLNKKFAVVSGWGITEDGFKSMELLKAYIPVIPNEYCRQIYEKHSTIGSGQLCAGGFGGRDSCGGDSGGPLKFVSKINSTVRYIQYGIVSYGPRHCGADGQPGVYTRVTHYVKWILDNLKPG